MSTVFTEQIIINDISYSEILRYAGCKSGDDTLLNLVNECLKEIENLTAFKVCYCALNISQNEDFCDFESFKVYSENLSKNLDRCKKVLLFAATAGVEMDRLIAKYSRISPLKALIFQSIGAERVEAVCDKFCEEYEQKNNVKLKRRFSPGYGDLDIKTQKEIFKVLDCSRKIGLSLNESLLMSPAKSVTAFAGIME